MNYFKDKPYKEPITIQEFAAYAASKNIELVPEAEGFKVGDPVIFTNDYGVVFRDLFIKGIDKNPTTWGARFYIFDDAYWFPVEKRKLKIA